MKAKSKDIRQGLTVDDWQGLMDKYMQAAPAEARTKAAPYAIRIENTMFSVARYSGGMTYNGEHYVYCEAFDHKQPRHADGSPYVAWLMVREDFFLWAQKERAK